MGNDHMQAMRTLQKWYHDVKNYSTIAYDVMVHRSLADDTIAIMGAREGWLSAATQNRNDLGEAICIFGYFTPGHALSEHPTIRELEALAYAVAWSIEMGWSAPDTKVLGHRDNPAHPNATTCPGDYLYPHVPWIGRRAQELLAVANHTPEPEPDPDPEEDTMYAIYYPGDAIKHLTDVHFAAFNSGIVRHCSGPDVDANPDVRRVPIKGTAHFNQLARAANAMAGADITLLPE